MRGILNAQFAKRRSPRAPADVYRIVLGDGATGRIIFPAAVVASRRDAIRRDVGLRFEHGYTGAELRATRQPDFPFDKQMKQTK